MEKQVMKVMILSLLLVSGLDQANGLCLGEALGYVAGGVIAVAATPVVLGAAGFTAGGIAAGSLAASTMSAAATTGVGAGVVGTLQSVGAAGLGVAGKAIVGAAGSYVGSKLGSASCEDDGRRDCH